MVAGQISIEQAVRLHQAGDIAAAAAAYRHLLAKGPRQPQLLNLLGVACLQLGSVTEAVTLLKEAVKRQPQAADFHDNLGSALRTAGDVEGAIAAHRTALRLKPDHPPMLFNLGNALAAAGRHGDAIAPYQTAHRLRPSHAATLFNLGNSQQALGQLPAAAASYRQLLSLQPDHAQGWNNLGGVLVRQEDLPAAADAYRQAARLRPNHAETLSNLGNVLLRQGRLAEAVAQQQAAITTDPGHGEAYIHLGAALQELDRLTEAISAYREGLKRLPTHVEGLANLGSALEQNGQVAEALPVLRQALSLDPGNGAAWGNLALCHIALGEIEAARTAMDKALTMAPDLARVRVARALLRLEQGEWTSGWADYASRFQAGEALPDRRFAIPAWDGRPLPDGHLLIWREQGLGDELMFASFYRQALARVGRVTIECDPRLVGLFTRSFPTATIRPAPAAPPVPERPTADCHIPAGSLPGLLAPGLDGFDGTPFLVPDKRRQAAMAAWLDTLPPGLRIGLCWRSRLRTSRRRASYLAASDFAPLVRHPQIQPICLQYDAEPAELAALEAAAGQPLHRPEGLDQTADIEGVAALIAGLDLVITVPVSVGEIAGALGTPVWRLCGARDWSKLGTGIRPWFASMRALPLADGVGGALRLLTQLEPAEYHNVGVCSDM